MIKIITVLCGGKGLAVPDRRSLARAGVQFKTYDNKANLKSPSSWYNIALSDCYDADILVYTHDDLTIHDAHWLGSVTEHFMYDPNIVAVGLGGATGLGHPNLYKRPYRLDDMARQGYVSNQTDAETHGKRSNAVHRVAVLDAFFMAVRRDFLCSVGGWPNALTHHCLDLWLACEAARAGKDTMVVGTSCTHHGGGTSIKPAYSKAQWLKGGTVQSDHTLPHKWIYENYRDVLPILGA